MSNLAKTTFLLASLTGLFLFVGNTIAGQQGMLVGLIIAAIMNFTSYFFSDKIVLAQYGAKEADKAVFGDVYAILRRLTQRASIPMPRLFILDMPTPNAFATGRDQNHAVVAISKSLISALSPEELEGVIAHELGHIKNADMLISTVAATIAGAISYIANIAMYIGPMRSRDDDRGSNPLSMLILVIFTPIAATLIHLAISRSREFVADEFAANLTHRPLALVGALRKISGYAGRHPLSSSQSHSSSAHLFIVNPFDSAFFAKLFSTHPPLHERIAKLESMTR